MKIKESNYLASAVWEEQYPEATVPEIAFAGRSNVGKSSIINMLLNRKNLARTSGTPGKTQTINFYDVEDQFRFVDLPGYGFAKVSKTKKKSWGKIIETYLNRRSTLMEVILLVDVRHKPSKEDKDMYQWIKACGFNGIVVATKADKLSKGQVAKQEKIIREELMMDADATFVAISSTSRFNKYEMWDIFNQLFEINGFPIHFERQVKERK